MSKKLNDEQAGALAQAIIARALSDPDKQRELARIVFKKTDGITLNDVLAHVEESIADPQITGGNPAFVERAKPVLAAIGAAYNAGNTLGIEEAFISVQRILAAFAVFEEYHDSVGKRHAQAGLREAMTAKINEAVGLDGTPDYSLN